MTDNEITEDYFKALGWIRTMVSVTSGDPACWIVKNRMDLGIIHKGAILPDILESFSAFQEHVLEVMGEEGFYPTIVKSTIGGLYFIWENNFLGGKTTFSEVIKSNNILHAAVIAATRYFKEKNG